MWQDLRYGIRLISKNPRLTAAVVLTLALGIGANSLVFSVVRAVILRPLDYEKPEQLVQLWSSGNRSGGESDWVSFPDYRDWSRQNRVFEETAAYRYWPLTLSGDKEAQSALGLLVTDRLFSVLGVKPVLGRTFLPGEDSPGRETVAVVSYGLWQSRYGRDPATVGRQVNIGGIPHSIIGVMPPSFYFPGGVPFGTTEVPIDVWLPIQTTPDLEQRGARNFWSIARLKSDVTPEQAQAGMDSIAANLARQYPATNKDVGVSVASIQEHTTRNVRPALLILLASVGLLLLLACANIANLLLSRAESRRREMSIRQAIGASRGRLVRQALIESILLALPGGAAALAIASFGLDLALKLAPQSIPRIQQTSIDAQVLLFTGAIAIGAGILFGLAPALVGARTNVQVSLKQAGTSVTPGRATLAVRHVLIAGQMGLAVMLLISAGLLIRSFVNVARVDPGFQADQLVMGILNLAPTRYADPQRQAAFFEEAVRRIRAAPGVLSAAVSNSVPLTGLNDQGGFRIEGRPRPEPGQDGPQANRPSVSSGYFETMGIPLVEGRVFDERDRADTPNVAIVSDIAARTYWPNENPIGKRVSVDGGRVWRQVVGIVRSTRHFGLEAPQKAEIYLPHTQSPSPIMILVVRFQGDMGAAISASRREIAAIDPQQAGVGMVGMQDLMFGSRANRRFQTILLTTFAILAMFLAAVGIYGVTAHIVARRTREIGIRLALGGRPSDVVAMVLKRELLITAAGVAAGVAGAIALSRVLASLLFGVSPLDPATFATVVMLLMSVAGISAYLPIRRAAEVDPVVALRED